MSAPSERDCEAVALRAAGKRFREIAEAIGVSKSRAAQIVYKAAHQIRSEGTTHQLYSQALHILGQSPEEQA